jgi:hypothetical protein
MQEAKGINIETVGSSLTRERRPENGGSPTEVEKVLQCVIGAYEWENGEIHRLRII